MKLNKDAISALSVTDEIKADLTALFSDIESKQTELDSIRAKLPTDSQKVVESVDYDKFLAATSELAEMKERAKKSVENLPLKDESFLEPFAVFFGE